jgi:hypothetical protein
MTDSQVAAHFSSKRPILGLCLKRYSMTQKGKAMRLGTRIDIPVEIGLPHFIQDDYSVQDNAPLFGNFKLSLQSVVCHRGNSVSSGHYISLVRATNTTSGPTTQLGPMEDAEFWLRFDDLAAKRVTLVDIQQALKDETPYLLFYQIVPIEGDPGHITDGELLPPYASSAGNDSGVAGLSQPSLSLISTREDQPQSRRPSGELSRPDSPRGRSPIHEARRPSIVFTDTGKPLGESDTLESRQPRFSSRPSSKTRKSASHNRSQGQASEMLSRSLSRLGLAGRKSNEALPPERVSETKIMVTEIASLSGEPVDHPRASTLPAKPSTAHPPLVDPPLARHPKPSNKDGKREKSKNRLSKTGGGSGKARAERPDRDCLVM